MIPAARLDQRSHFDSLRFRTLCIEVDRLSLPHELRIDFAHPLRDWMSLFDHSGHFAKDARRSRKSHESQHSIVLRSDAVFYKKISQPLQRMRRVQRNEKPSLSRPVLAQQHRLAHREVILRREDQQCPRVVRHLLDIRQFQRLELDVLPLDVSRQRLHALRPGIRLIDRFRAQFRPAVARHHVKLALLFLGQFQQRTRHRLLTLECLQRRRLPHHDPALIHLRHVRRVHKLALPLVVQDHHVFVRAKLVFVLKRACP